MQEYLRPILLTIGAVIKMLMREPITILDVRNERMVLLRGSVPSGSNPPTILAYARRTVRGTLAITDPILNPPANMKDTKSAICLLSSLLYDT